LYGVGYTTLGLVKYVGGKAFADPAQNAIAVVAASVMIVALMICFLK
jgi:hypothetical protein